MASSATATDVLRVSHTQATKYVAEVLTKRLTPMLHGSPGIGKSDIFRAIGKAYRLYVIDLRTSQCDPTDLNGMPTVFANGKAGYLPMDTFPIEGDPVPEGYDGWLLFLDELSSAPPAIQAASYKLILDRMVGQHRLHPKCVIAGAGNLETDNAIVEEMSTALKSRLVHFELELIQQDWLDWAADNGIDHRIMDYIKFKPSSLYTFSPDHSDRTYACPRTWAFASAFTVDHKEITHERLPILAGTVSHGIAREFINYCAVYKDLPTIHQIVQSPETTPVPGEPSVLWALSGSIATNATLDNMEPLMKFVNRMARDFQVITLRETVRRNKALMKHLSIMQWALKHGDALY